MNAADLKMGLSTKEALTRLCTAIRNEITHYEEIERKKSFLEKWPKTIFSTKNVYSSVQWSMILVLIIEIIILVGSLCVPNELNKALRVDVIVQISVIFIMLVLNCWMVSWDLQITYHEMANRARNLVGNIERQIEMCKWDTNCYPDLCNPQSPCITLQWTYRDDNLVSLPQNLLVQGDVIAMRPGHVAPALCSSLDESEAVKLQAGQQYLPTMEGQEEIFSGPQQRTALGIRKFVILECPYISSLRICLSRSLARPSSSLNKERHVISVKHIMNFLLPLITVLMLTANVLRYSFQPQYVGSWVEMFMLLQVNALIPLLPLVFPVLWILLIDYGVALVIAAFENPVAINSRSYESIAEETELMPAGLITWQQVLPIFLDVLRGNSACTFPCTASLLHALGSVTAFCCVDKKGVLSWPNPTAEKVFFLTDDKPEETSMSQDSGSVLESKENLRNMRGDEVVEHSDKLAPLKFRPKEDAYLYPKTTTQVLDLSNDNHTPFSIQFDDPKWTKHLNSLKPLGLNVLLNTCNLDTVDFYTDFTDHVFRASLNDKDAVAVVNRRCLCEMPHQIGFSGPAVDIFDLEQQLAIYKNLASPENREKFLHKVQSFIKFKTPLPNLFSVIVREQNSGMKQLLTQGTADLVLDCCTDFWNGHDLVPLMPPERKKVLDFYHRSSLTAYCSAFAYRPLAQSLSKESKNVIIELPADCPDLFDPIRSPSPARSWDVESLDSRFKIRSRYFSDDSLMSQDTSGLLNDSASIFQAQCNQVFIGLVTMQYQARPDIVQLIENLETACIRFVHFSEENELRSRVFSEKMGLEAGWNCHISLLSDDGNLQSAKPPKSTGGRTKMPIGRPEILGLTRSKEHKGRWNSAPNIASMPNTGQVKFDECKNGLYSGGYGDSPELGQCDEYETVSLSDIHADSTYSEEQIRLTGIELSASRMTSSTDQSIPGGFDMANRAKLPKGIEKIRPHIENVDNVPLLVPLYTDAIPATTIEMFRIMQEYGEVVCCLGSSLNIYNVGAFMQADISISVMPLYPQICMKEAVFEETCDNNGLPGPMEISRKLNSLPCSLTFKKNDPTKIIQLIMQARSATSNIRNCCHFLLSCELSVTFIQFFATVCLLPPVINGSQVLWLTCVVIPLLSISLLPRPVDAGIMKKATGKNCGLIKWKVVFTFLLLYMSKFFPSLIVCLLCFGFTLNHFCVRITGFAELCDPLHGDTSFGKSGEWNGWGSGHAAALCIAQNVVSFLLTLYFALISLGYICRYEQLWKQPPTVNKVWCFAMPAIVVLQLLYFMLDMFIHTSAATVSFMLSDIPLTTWCLGLLWPILLISINELVKRREIKLEVRYQKRERLNFGTKLGMNSPF